MKTRNIKVITRYYCPETNSSSSHSFVMSRERFKESDLMDGNQTLIPEIDSSGRKVITIDGSEISNFDSFKHANDSETKLYYLLASIRYILGSKAAKDMFELISKIIKDTLKVDEVVYKNISGLQIDHESTNLLTDLVHSKDYISYQDFIFNPRIWLFFFWDCDNSEDNQSFNLCDDYFKYGLTVKIPVEVRLFESASRIDEVEFFYNCLTDLADSVADLIILMGGQGLGTVTEGAGGIVVDFDHQTVGSGCRGGAGHGGNQTCLAGGMAGVYDYGQMAQLVEYGYSGKVQGVTGTGLEGADAPFAENHIFIALTHNVFGTHKKFFQGVGKTTLQKNGGLGSAQLF